MLVLLSLSGKAKHGYAITTDVLEQTGVHLGPGTLHGALTKMVGLGFIVPPPSDDRRRPCELTATGRTALAAQLETCSRVVHTGRNGWAPA